jgi:glyoxylase-like metal-dependent hydrolase (beta-lactamase superfamily II)
MRELFPLVSAGVSKVLPPNTLRWVSFGHVEADESGSMNHWLAIAPHATVAQSEIGCMVSIADLADRPPRPLADGEELDIGGHIVQWVDTPHVPHAWEAGVLYDKTTETLFCGDLFTRFGDYEATSSDDIVGPAVQAENDAPGSLSLHPSSGTVIRRPRHRRRRPADDWQESACRMQLASTRLPCETGHVSSRVVKLQTAAGDDPNKQSVATSAIRWPRSRWRQHHDSRIP